MDELFDMLGLPDWKPSGEKKTLPKRIAAPPDAVVLISLTTVCRCGEKFATPNRRVMLRLGESLLGIKQDMWRAEYNDLPREVEEVETEVLACEKCFGNTTFTSLDF